VGVTAENPFSVISVHALALTVTLALSLPPTVARARRSVLENLQRHTDSATLEKLHVESQLAIVTEKIASHLHGDVRGNFLASVLNLQRHIDSGNTDEARATIEKLRSALASPMDLSPPDVDSEGQLAIFIKNWSAILDIEFERPMSTIPAEFMSAFHTVVVDAVNNAVRHGSADWVRIGFTIESDALALNIRNNGNPRATARVGLGTIHLNQLAPDNWSRFTNDQGITQLVVRLERQNLGVTVTPR
jgi:signal transduction histidine kinase